MRRAFASSASGAPEERKAIAGAFSKAPFRAAITAPRFEAARDSGSGRGRKVRRLGAALPAGLRRPTMAFDRQHEKPAGEDDCPTDQYMPGRQIAEDQPAPQCRPGER